jgi:hypothetical protein
MQHPPVAASAGNSSPGRYVVRLSGALAALLGRREGAELWEDDVLGMLREHGLVTYPSPLLGRLLEKVPEVLEKEVLAQLDATDHAMIAQVARPWLAAAWQNNFRQFVVSLLKRGFKTLGDDVAHDIRQALSDVGGLRLAARGAGRGGAAQGRGVCRVGREVGMGEGQLVPMAAADVRTSHWRRAPGGVAVGAGARLRLGRGDVRTRRWGRAPEGVDVGAGAGVPVGGGGRE